MFIGSTSLLLLQYKSSIRNGVYFASSSSVQELHSKKHDITAVLDIGATRSVLGLRAARKVVRAAGQRFSLPPSNRSFRFGVQVHRSLGSIRINVPTPFGVLTFVADVIQAGVPLLIGLETLDSKSTASIDTL
jgi:hypothetical protein